MNINDFKNQLRGGGARSNMFRVNGTFPAAAAAVAGQNPANQIQFLCTSASLPMIDITPVTVNYQGRPLKLAGDRSFSPWTIQILNDTSFSLRNAFEKWSDTINRMESNVSRNGLGEYAQTWSVTQLSRSGDDIKTYKFIDCWPSNISAIDLNFDPATSIETFSVTLEYQYYQAEGTSS